MFPIEVKGIEEKCLENDDVARIFVKSEEVNVIVLTISPYGG